MVEKGEMAPVVGGNYINSPMAMVSTFHLGFLLHHDNILETTPYKRDRRSLRGGFPVAEKEFSHPPATQVLPSSRRHDDYFVDNA